tara:strand:- start:1679 stop:2794 length:1116 start_codon:yes stop_codon:yes gene_type:complete
LKKGFSLPVWVTAASMAALSALNKDQFDDNQKVVINDSGEIVEINIFSAMSFDSNNIAVAVTHVDSQIALDITRGLEIWTFIKYVHASDKQSDLIKIIPGIGVGKYKKTNEICISMFTKELLQNNLYKKIKKGFSLEIELAFFDGRELAERTSNEAFGIVDGLAVIGTSPFAYQSSSPEQINLAREKIINISSSNSFRGYLLLVVGENGLDLAKNNFTNIPIIKVGNWIGPLLVEAAEKQISNLILFGYHGKLIKLAGGIFHTHNHLADARKEVLTYIAIQENLPLSVIQKIQDCSSMQEAFNLINDFDKEAANKLWLRVANNIEIKANEYVRRYMKTKIQIGVLLFDRERKIRWKGQNGLLISKNLNCNT